MNKEIIKKEKNENQEKKEILGSPFMPQGFEGKLKLAEILHNSGLCPKDMDSKEKVFVALQYGHELGLSPMIAVQNIAVINKRPALSTMIMKGISFNSGKIEYFKTLEILGENNKILGYETIGKRKDYPDEFKGSFTFEQAKKAGLYDKNMSVWLKYEHDMCKNRSESRFFKAAFSELFAGLLTKEEAENLDPIDITPKKENQNLLQKVKENMDLAKVSDFEINDFEKEEEKPEIIDTTGVKLNENGDVAINKLNEKNSDKKESKNKADKDNKIYTDGKTESQKSNFVPIDAYQNIFSDDRARNLKDFMTDKDKEYFYELVRLDAEKFKEKDYKKALKIIRDYEEKHKEELKRIEENEKRLQEKGRK